ncbi:MAG: TetR/AcrR family transcriptional regulator [Cryomorphaceae bacterium]|nr:TetR/AcrR family transcriptional regulator [Cryomorphaceae bacterium]MBL6682696.1 TetR/AcrR family transcriptional regulator [Cryomorphaceae bacterium]MBL6867907.1 TetR/AcrR family transcriptional regulator [Cryomorphaceae bacterium]
MESELSRVLFNSTELFLQFGIKSVNMDQIASSCGISKKTLYKHVKNKEDLLEKAFEQAVVFMKAELEEAISNVDGNAIDQLFAMERFAEVHVRDDKDRMLHQLEHYYPSIATNMKAKREDIVFTVTKRNLEQGIREGLYRADLHVDHITLLYYGHILAVHEGVVSNENIKLDQLRKTSLRYHIRGIASANGLEYLNQLIATQ